MRTLKALAYSATLLILTYALWQPMLTRTPRAGNSVSLKLVGDVTGYVQAMKNAREGTRGGS